jgi:hypothetical protein
MFATVRNERGVGVAFAILFILVLATLGYLCLALTVEDMHGGAAHVDSELAFGVAQAGLEFGVKKLASSPSWTGLGSPGKPVGRGAFTVTVTSTDENGAALPAGQQMVLSTGTVGTAVRKLRKLVGSGAGGTSTVFATAYGDAVNIPSQKQFIGMAGIHDSSSGPNGVWGHGGFNSSDNESGVFTTWGGTGLSGTVTTVEAALYGYVTASLTNDVVNLTVYYGNAVQGSAFTLTTAELNTHVGAANKGYWYKDVTSARAWTLADFSGDLELYVLANKVTSDDGRDIYLDAVGFRVTASSAGGEVAASFREVAQ